MDTIIQSIHHHQVIWTLGTYIVASNAVNSMPQPDKSSGKFYTWLFGFLHGVMLQAGRFMQDKLKGVNGNAQIQDNVVNVDNPGVGK